MHKNTKMLRKMDSHSDSSDTGNENYKFQLVEFIKTKKNGTSDIEVVPTSWISCDWKTKICQIKYPRPPYTKKSCALLQLRVQREQPPLEKWPLWDINIKGHADTYDVALRRLEKLTTEQYAFTTDAETNPKVKASCIMEKFAKKSTAELFQVKSLQRDDGRHVPTDDASESSSSSRTSRAEKSTFSRRAHSRSFRRQRYTKEIASGQSSFTESSINASLSNDSVSSKKTAHQTATEGSAHSRDKNNNGETIQKQQPPSMDFTGDASLSWPLNEKGKWPKVLASRSTDFKSDTKESGSYPKKSVQSLKKLQTSKKFVPGSKDIDKSKTSSTKIVASKESVVSSNVCLDRFDEHTKIQKTYSEETMFLVSIMKRFSIDLRNNTAAINLLHDTLVGNGTIDLQKATIENFTAEYEIQLPFGTVQEFQEFDLLLKENEVCYNNLMSSLRHLLDRSNNMTKSCTTIFRKFFMREVMMTFTAKKQVYGKTLLRATSFGTCMIAALTGYHTHSDGIPVRDEEALKCAGNAIANAKDWDGRRPRSSKKLPSP